MPAAEYYQYKKVLRADVQAAYDRLDRDFDIIVIEGAGSPAEINLREDDFVNMGMAELADAQVLLCGDIDRGGVFASLYGTVKLLEPREQDRIRGLLINKFRGDIEILRPGLRQLEELTGKPVLGVVPMLDVDIDDEDSLSERLQGRESVGLIDISVIRLPRLSNFTDFNPLERLEPVRLRYVQSPRELGRPDLVILPGTKSTMDDLRWLRESGLENAILRHAASGGAVLGICGGYQMLCREITDPEGSEGGGTLRGLGLLPGRTVFRREKTRTQVEGTFVGGEGVFAALRGAPVTGYEIHMGETESPAPVLSLRDQRGEEKDDGRCAGNVLGCYIHGLFDRGEVAAALVDGLMEARGLTAKTAVVDAAAYREAQYDKLAQGLREALDMEQIYRILNKED